MVVSFFTGGWYQNISWLKDMASRNNGEDFYITLEFGYDKLWVIGNSKITGDPSSYGAVTSSNYQSYGEAEIIFAAKRGTMGEYKGVGGFGISIEFAVPKWLLIRKGDYAGVGIDFGILRDKKGLGFYATTKTTLESGVAASIQFEGFGASRRNSYANPIDRMVLNGPGYETSLGIGPFGGSYSTDNSADYGRMPIYHMFTYSLGIGIDAGYVNWNTNTYVSGK